MLFVSVLFVRPSFASRCSRAASEFATGNNNNCEHLMGGACSVARRAPDDDKFAWLVIQSLSSALLASAGQESRRATFPSRTPSLSPPLPSLLSSHSDWRRNQN